MDSLNITFSKGFCSSVFPEAAAEVFGEKVMVGITTVAFATVPRSLRFLDGLPNNTFKMLLIAFSSNRFIWSERVKTESSEFTWKLNARWARLQCSKRGSIQGFVLFFLNDKPLSPLQNSLFMAPCSWPPLAP